MGIIIRKVLLGALLFILMFAAACSPKASPLPTADEGAGEGVETTAPVQETQPAGVDAETENEAPLATPGVPDDIPVMEGAYKLQVARAGAYVIYQVDGAIEDVVTFYQQELPNFGWHEVRSPDTSMGAMATILRENDGKDRLNISMQKNELGGFVAVTISVQRVP